MSSIKIHPVEAEILRDVSSIGKMDPYCKITVGTLMRTTVPHVDGSKRPKWKDELYFSIDNEEACKIDVWDRNTVSSDEHIGTCTFTVSDIRAAGTFDEWLNLSYNGRNAGRIHVHSDDPNNPQMPP
jgi:Ca2+-dependent lipid-binding protein